MGGDGGVGAGSAGGGAGEDSLGCMPNVPGCADGFPVCGGSGSSVGAVSAAGRPSVLAGCLPKAAASIGRAPVPDSPCGADGGCSVGDLSAGRPVSGLVAGSLYVVGGACSVGDLSAGRPVSGLVAGSLYGAVEVACCRLPRPWSYAWTLPADVSLTATSLAPGRGAEAARQPPQANLWLGSIVPLWRAVHA